MEVRRVRLPDLDLALARLRQLPEAAVREKVHSLRARGQLSPLVAADCDGKLLLVDGFSRYQAALRLGLDALHVAIVTLPPAQMKAQVYLRNRERGLLLLEECQLVRELCDLDGLAQTEVADLLEHHKAWVCRRLALLRSLSPHLLAEGTLGSLTGGSLRRLAQLQPRNQEHLLAAVARDGVPPADVGALADLYRLAPDGIARAYVIDQPVAALEHARRRAERKVDPRLGPAGQELLAALAALRHLGLRVARAAGVSLGAIPPEALAQLATATAAAERDCTAAITAATAALATHEPRKDSP